MPSVRISLRILSCEEDPEDPAQQVLKMDGEACTISPRVDTLGAIGLSMFVLYGILPYLTMACVMIREAARGSLRRKLRESDTFFIMFGWAAAPYKESAFFWESVNAATIVSTVTVTELMGGPSRTTAHIIIFSVALVLQIVVRPFDDFYANVSVTLFTLCELFGALGELNVAAFQWIYVLTFLFALIVTGKFAVSALVERVKQQRQRPSAASGLEYDSPTSLSKCERALVAPFLLLVTVAVTCILAFVAFLYGLFRMLAGCAYKSTRKDYDRIACTKCWTPSAWVCSASCTRFFMPGARASTAKRQTVLGSGVLLRGGPPRCGPRLLPDRLRREKHKAEARAKVKTNGWEEPPRQIPPSSQQVSKPPKKWARFLDPSTGRPYFYNESTGESSWTCPLSAWAEAVDPASGRTYFYNSATKETSWTRPESVMADRWRKAIHARLLKNKRGTSFDSGLVRKAVGARAQSVVELAEVAADRQREAISSRRASAAKRLQDRLMVRKGLLRPEDRTPKSNRAAVVRPKSALEAMAEEETMLASHRVQAEALRASKLHSEKTRERRKTSDQRLAERLAARNKVKSSRCLQKCRVLPLWRMHLCLKL